MAGRGFGRGRGRTPARRRARTVELGQRARRKTSRRRAEQVVGGRTGFATFVSGSPVRVQPQSTLQISPPLNNCLMGTRSHSSSKKELGVYGLAAHMASSCRPRVRVPVRNETRELAIRGPRPAPMALWRHIGGDYSEIPCAGDTQNPYIFLHLKNTNEQRKSCNHTITSLISRPLKGALSG